jgi:hypothetical protein
VPNSILKPIALATLVAGVLDIAAAIGLALFYGRDPMNMLRTVASGPFPGATGWGTGGAALGLAVHFALMAIMAAIFVAAAERMRTFRAHPVRWGVVYGLVTYVAMNLVVVPLRWPETFPPTTRSIATQLFCHIVLVGIPIALIAVRYLRKRPFG